MGLRIYTLLGISLVAFAVTACSDNENLEANYPQGAREERRDSRGSLLGEGGWDLLGKDDEIENASPIGVNGFLWRATLDTLSFMPLATADPFGGTILTDWYEDPKTPGERYKVNAIILDKRLRSDGVRISVFKQRYIDGNWREQPLDETLARQLEDTVLTRARQLRISQLGR